MKEKLDDSYELMLAIERFLMDKLNATIDGHGTTTDFKDNEADCDVRVDGNRYNITISKNNEEDDD
tara:strand:+ start:273 stop:470 length:198 start_codon:yes stop_codon:yes gene_type:complete